jgi:uncharacterized protein with HEPN domain
MPKQRDKSYLLDILDAGKKILKIIEGKSFEEFERDLTSPLAVARLLEIVGEASKNISNDLKEKYPGLPWKGMAGMRDVLIHQYRDADLVLIFETAKKRIPDMVVQIEKIISELDKASSEK